MRVAYVAFSRPSLQSCFTIFGHVQLVGVTKDDVWMFFNPTRTGYKLFIVHDSEEVSDLLGGVLAESDEVLRYQTPAKPYRLPHVAPLTCAAVCGNIVGVRAFTPRGLRRKLLQNGAEIVDAKP